MDTLGLTADPAPCTCSLVLTTSVGRVAVSAIAAPTDEAQKRAKASSFFSAMALYLIPISTQQWTHQYHESKLFLQLQQVTATYLGRLIGVQYESFARVEAGVGFRLHSQDR